MTAETKLLAYAAGLEAAAFGSLLAGSYFVQLSAFLLFHSGASALAALPAWRLLPEKYRRPRLATMAFVFMVVFSVSAVGYLLLLWLNAVLLRRQQERRVVRASFLDTEALQSDLVAMPVRRMGEAAVQAIGGNEAVSRDMRMRAVLLLSEMSVEMPGSMHLLKSGVRSQDDEVRMFSFSVIDSLEKRITGKIHERLQDFKNGDGDKQGRAARELAALYWEYVHLGIVDEDFCRIMMRESENYARIAQKHLPEDPELLMILGKIALSRGNRDEALDCFTRGREKCSNPARFAAYLAEAYYDEKKYREAGAVMRAYPAYKFDPLMSPVAALWEGA